MLKERSVLTGLYVKAFVANGVLAGAAFVNFLVFNAIVFGVLVSGALVFGVQAQELPPDDGGFEVETGDTVQDEGGFLSTIDQYVGATVGSTTSASDAVEKEIQALSLKFDIPAIRSVRTTLSVDVGNYKNTYTLKLDKRTKGVLAQCQDIHRLGPNFLDASSVPGSDPRGLGDQNSTEQNLYRDLNCASVIDPSKPDNPQYLKAEKKRIVKNSFADIVEGFIQWEPTSFATIRLGRQPIVLGQFEVFSPTSFLTPLRATGTKTRTGKADLSFAQDGIQLSVFPLQQLEVSFTSIPKMRIDEATEKRFKEFGAVKSDFVNYTGNTKPNEKLQDVGDNDMSIARALYFGDGFTFGLTSIQGADTNEDPVRDAKLAVVSCISLDKPSVPAVSRTGVMAVTDCDFSINPMRPNGYNAYALGNDKGIRYGDLDAMALELSIILTSKWSFAAEYIQYETQRDLDMLPFGGQYGSRPRDPNELKAYYANQIPETMRTFDPTLTNLEKVYTELIAQNGRRPYINMDIVMAGMGLVYKGDRWLSNLQLVYRTEEGASAREEKWRKATDRDVFDNEENNEILPIVNVVRLLGAEKQGYAGLGFGLFSQSFGVGLTTGWRFFEQLEIGGFVGIPLSVNGADEIEAEGYESPESDSVASFGINYLF